MIEKKEEAALLAQNDPKEIADPVNLSVTSISEFPRAVKGNDLRTVLEIAEMSTRDAANLLRQYFPKMDKTIISKCCAPDKYGCVLHPDGFAAIGLRIGVGNTPEPVASDVTQETPQKAHRGTRHGKHKLTCRIAGRLPDGKFRALQRYIRMEGYETTQDWVVAQVDSFLKEMKEKYVRQD